MTVRNKLACLTGLGLLLLLSLFYIGGRLVVVNTFKQTSQRLLHELPKLRGAVSAELDQIEGVAKTVAMTGARDAVHAGGAEGLPPGLASNLCAKCLDVLAVDLLAVAGAGGELYCAFIRDGQNRLPTPLQREDIGRLLQPDSVLVAGSIKGSHAPLRRGMVLISGTPVLVGVAPLVLPGDAAHGPVAFILMGRSANNTAMLRRIAASLPPESSVQQVAANTNLASSAVRGGEVVGTPVLLGTPDFWRTSAPIRVCLPCYDIHGRQIFALKLRLGVSCNTLADLSLAWLGLLVAGVGVLFILPLFLMQGHTVLNPLTRLVNTLQAFGKGIPDGRRLNWKRNDEFGVVTATIDQMLEAIDNEHRTLLKRNEHMRALLTASPDLIVVIDRDGVLTDVTNPSRGVLVGHFPPLGVGQNLREVRETPSEVIETFIQRVVDVVDSGRMQIYETGVRRAEGTLLWLEHRIVRLDERHALVMIRDMTARHRAQHERARIEERMVQVQKTESLGVLARGLAHDCNNILTAILGNVDVVMREQPAPAVREAVECIRLAIIRASNLTRQMLSYAGQGTFSFDTVDLNTLLKDLVNLMRRSITSQTEIVVDFADSVPLVEADATQIWQVVMNLLINASDAITTTSGTITLTTSHATPAAAELESYLATVPLQPGDYALIEVRDNGHGMDKRTIERIYDPFFTTKSMGRGLGLSACLGIVRGHNGGISVESKSGKGTCFRILLPAARDSEGRVRFPRTAEPGIESAAPVIFQDSDSVAVQPKHCGERGGILVVDDDPAILKLVGIFLSNSGFSVVAAESGAEALRLFDQDPQRICVALIDATLKNGTSGREVYEALRARKPRLPVIIMSGFRETDIGLEFSKSNCCAFLPKPFMSTELLALVDKACVAANQWEQESAAGSPEEPCAQPQDECAGEAADDSADERSEEPADKSADAEG